MVIGAPKCGTTSLFANLKAHPQIATPANKELCFFSPFKRYIQRNQPLPSSNWNLYTASFAGTSAYMHAEQALGIVRGRRRSRPEFVQGRRLQQGSTNCEARQLHAFEACPFYLGEVEAATMIHTVFPSLHLVAILRNPRERTISAFNDYVRMGHIRGRKASALGMDALVRQKISMLERGERGLEDFDMRILTSGCYIYGLEEWGRVWPTAQLLVLRSEDMFYDTAKTMGRLHSFLGLEQQPQRNWGVSNRGTKKAAASNSLDGVLDAFFAPYNARLYAWADQRGLRFERWPNATEAPVVDLKTRT